MWLSMQGTYENSILHDQGYRLVNHIPPIQNDETDLIWAFLSVQQTVICSLHSNPKSWNVKPKTLFRCRRMCENSFHRRELNCYTVVSSNWLYATTVISVSEETMIKNSENIKFMMYGASFCNKDSVFN